MSSTATASTKPSPSHAPAALCAQAAKGHEKITKAEIAACRAAPSVRTVHCSNGPNVIIKKVGKTNYALRLGHKPTRLKRDFNFAHDANLCGNPTTTTTAAPTSTSTTSPTGVQVGPGPQSAYSVEPQPAPNSCHYTYVGSEPLPDGRCTPGAINPQVTQGTINATICRSGYTSTIRPPETVTEKEKTTSAAAYGYTGSFHTAEYDHLISLELGGDPNDPANLWVEPNDKPSATSTANTKDLIENKLNELVCSGQITLAAAQQEIATNWIAAYNKYVVSATAAPSTTVPTAAVPVTGAPASVPAAAPASSCYPKTDGGNCYKAGELCRSSDHGASGLAGNGESIKCENNDGWRWEPA
jgi:hypothetical protein